MADHTLHDDVVFDWKKQDAFDLKHRTKSGEAPPEPDLARVCRELEVS